MSVVESTLKKLCGVEQHEENALKIPLVLRLFLAAVGGTCVFLAFPDYDQFYLAWIALAFELWAIEGLSAKKAFWIILFAGTITNIGGFYWLESTLEVFGHFPVWLSWILCVLVCMVQALVFAIWGAFTAAFRNARFPRLTSLAALLAIEWCWPMIFPWYIANSQNNFIWSLQVADILGVLGVSLLVASINMVIFDFTRTLVKRMCHQKAEFDKGFYFGALAYILFCYIYAPIRIAQIDAIQTEAPKLRVGMVEGDVGVWLTENPEKVKNNLFEHHRLSKEADLQNVDLIVWPESGYTSYYVWGSRLQNASQTELELDALYSDWFKPQARQIYAAVDEFFGAEFRESEFGHDVLHKSISAAAQMYHYAPIDVYYTALANGYAVRCFEGKPYTHKCPFASVTPDDLQWYYPSRVPLGISRQADLSMRVRPYDIASPIRDFKAPIFFGTVTTTLSENKTSDQEVRHNRKKRRILYNTAKLIDNDGHVLGSYHKKYLMPFGEYMPFGDEFPEIYDLIPEAGRLTKGEAPVVMQFGDYTLGPIICYEDIIPSYVRELSKLEPQVLLNVTDDAWFGKTTEPYQHLALAALRSVEQRKWLIRSTNTGVSAYVDANGRITKQTSLYDPEILIEDVAMMPKGRTVYSYIGDVLGWTSAAWLIFLMGTRYATRKRRSKQQANTDGEVERPADLSKQTDIEAQTT